jgi:hypothetical protein
MSASSFCAFAVTAALTLATGNPLPLGLDPARG